jgi:hypothetical protein
VESDEARRNVGLLSSEDDEEEDDDESEEARRSVGRELSVESEDPDEEYVPESFGSGCRITGRVPAVPEREPEPEFELLEPESESARRRVGRLSSRGVSREVLEAPLLNSMRAISPTSIVWMLSPTSTLIWRGVPPR